MTELTEESMKEYDKIQQRLMDEFINNISPWIDWVGMSGFEESMARSAVRSLISLSYYEGTMNGIRVMHQNMKEFHDDAMRDR
jgi:hypothetical protein|nr:MAG TPA: hypothetical protein [Caudoviricetes sp.]